MDANGSVGGRHLGAAPRLLRMRGDAGAVVVEAAIGIPVLLAVAMTGMWGISVALASVSLAGAAGDAARALARGESWDAVITRSRAVAPDVLLRLDDGGDLVTVTASRDVLADTGLLRGMSFVLERSASAPAEWVVPSDGYGS